MYLLFLINNFSVDLLAAVRSDFLMALFHALQWLFFKLFNGSSPYIKTSFSHIVSGNRNIS
jgi:hypothetical protein